MKMPSESELRQRGYMTSDEFVDRLIPGLKDYLNKNWAGINNKEELHHPEDLISNVSIYVDIAFHVIGDFGVSEKTKDET